MKTQLCLLKFYSSVAQLLEHPVVTRTVVG
jgi:hypothetical protein